MRDLFDFNGDGKVTLDEEFIAFQMFEEATKEEKKNSWETDIFDDYDWREDAEDGTEYDLYPEDFDTQGEYEQALEEAEEQYAWRKKYTDDIDIYLETGLSESDYETEDEFMAAVREEMTRLYDEDYVTEYLETRYDYTGETTYKDIIAAATASSYKNQLVKSYTETKVNRQVTEEKVPSATEVNKSTIAQSHNSVKSESRVEKADKWIAKYPKLAWGLLILVMFFITALLEAIHEGAGQLLCIVIMAICFFKMIGR